MVIKMECLFCKIIKGEVPTLKLYEDDLVMVIMDAYPNVDGHTLIIPKKHTLDLLEIDDSILEKIVMKSKDIVLNSK